MKLLAIALLFSLATDSTKVTIENFFKETEYKEVSLTILALAALESGWFKSKRHVEFNNYFSIKEFDKRKRHPKCEVSPIYCMRQYNSLEEHLEDMLNYFRNKNYPTDKAGFLQRLDGIGGDKYAEDEDHVSKVKAVTKTIKRRRGLL
jgi:uncharacterized FlgJ-related protein